jgi:hypothetical protein
VIHQCHCGNNLLISWCDGCQTKCSNCGAIYQRDPMTNTVMWVNCRVVTTDGTLPIASGQTADQASPQSKVGVDGSSAPTCSIPNDLSERQS